jgi:hypothetical protein
MRDQGLLLRVKIPCDDEGEFYARLADHVAENGLRVPSDDPRPIGSKVRVALEFRDGRTLAGDAVVEEHVALDARSGVKVRFVHLDRAAGRPAPAGPPPPFRRLPVPPAAARPAPCDDTALADVLFADPTDGSGRPRASAPNLTGSAEIAAAVDRSTLRAKRGALVAAALALAVAVAGYLVARHVAGQATPEKVVAAHVRAADRLLSEGRLTGEDGALEHLLAAKRIARADAATNGRLARLADLLERLGRSALDRGDLVVASIHLESARLAAPDRASIRAKLEEVARRAGGPGRKAPAAGGR